MRKPTKPFLTLICSVAAVMLLGSGNVRGADSADATPGENGKIIYKKVGPNGEIIYSDKPLPGAQEVTVPPPSSYKSVPPPANFTPYQPPPKSAPSKAIENTLTITSPKSEETIWSAPGEVPVTVSLASALAPGQTLEYQLDGNTVLTTAETSHTFNNIDRGAHVLTVRLSDKSGNSLSSQPVTFYLQRPTTKK